MSTTTSTPTRPAYTLKVAKTRDEIEACYDIRIEVFSVEQGFPLDTEMDEHDPTAVHFLLTTPVSSPPDESTSSLTPTSNLPSTTEKPIGTIRFVPELGKLTRLAVLKEYRQYGFGRVLVEGMEKFIKDNAESEALNGLVKEIDGQKVIKIKCHSQIPVVAFYSRMGYVADGPEFDEEGAPHQTMYHKIVLNQ
ncbi:hypothetical protein CI109_106619 [Kwoniella shandongensis]|uniref:Uncharacterized protein n=1 Tax=Kwoniella shandongensis TaxID=1734106 RepID=A0A5M6BNN6_9TREE|nr:uncharacterized protein CI109_007161 [Kwoniella shandongensis]KAA5524506.1 hypothetical protein CI109_007161 [Kwoniella shandongensis]